MSQLIKFSSDAGHKRCSSKLGEYYIIFIILFFLNYTINLHIIKIISINQSDLFFIFFKYFQNQRKLKLWNHLCFFE